MLAEGYSLPVILGDRACLELLKGQPVLRDVQLLNDRTGGIGPPTGDMCKLHMGPEQQG